MTTTMPHTRPLSQVEIEQKIMSVIEELERQTEEYDDIAQAAAEAEADYKRDYARMVLAVVSSAEGKMTVDERTARVEASTTDAHRNYLIRQAARNARRESLLSLRDHLDALRTLSASVRAQT